MPAVQGIGGLEPRGHQPRREGKNVIEFTVYGQPRPAGSKRAFMRPGMKHPSIVDACEGSREWKNLVSDAARQAYQGPLLEGAIDLLITFVLLRPKSHFGTRKGESYLKDSAPYYVTSKPDLTKLTRATEDALKGIAWRDDSQVACQVTFKVYGEFQGAHVEVRQLNQSTDWHVRRVVDDLLQAHQSGAAP